MSGRNEDRTMTSKTGKEYVVKKIQLKRHSLPHDEIDQTGWSPNNPVCKAMLPLTQSKLTAKLDRVELREILQMSTKNSQEKVVLEMKRQGYTTNEIADRLKVSRVTVWKLMGVIEERLRGLLA